MMATNTSQIIQGFLRTLGEDIRLYRQLAVLLQAQKHVYLTFDATSLQHNIDQQAPLLKQLEHHANIRSQAMKTLGLTADQQGVERLFKVLPAQLAKQINQQWLTLQSLVDQCQQYNHENGASSASFHELISQLKRPASHTYAETVG